MLTIMPAVAAAVVVSLSSVAALAQDYPRRPLRLIAPFPPGGGVDFLARIVGQKLRFASAGNGSMLHLATELFAKRAGIKLTHVPYKGGGLGLNALLSNEVNLLCMTTSSLLPHVQQGRITALAISTAQRSQSLPDLRTIAEQGYTGYDTAQWIGMLVPKATPKFIVTKLHAESVRILALPDVRDRLKTAGVEAVGNTPDAFAAQIRADSEKYGKLAAELGIRLD